MNWIPETWIQTVGWTIVHSLWAITLLALGLRLILGLLPSRLAKFRYLVAVGTLLCSLITLVVIGIYVHQPSTTNATSTTEYPVTIVLSTPIVAEFAPTTPLVQQIDRQLQEWLAPHLSGILIIWFSGVLFFSIRGVGSLFYLHRLTRLDTQSISPRWQDKITQLTNILGIRRSLSVRISSGIRAPFVVGFLKPVILLPLSAFSQLSPEQLETILAHELAHIRRWDDIVNWIQAIVETVLFYHPALWWISQLIRDEREKCCDDLTVATCGNAIVYVKALTQLEALPSSTSSFALAASRSGNGLLKRVERLLQPNRQRSKLSLVPATAMILLIATLLSSFWLDPFTTHSSKTSPAVYSGAVLGLQPQSESEIPQPSSDSPWQPILPNWLQEESILDTIPTESDTTAIENTEKTKRNAYRYYFSSESERFKIDSLGRIHNMDSLLAIVDSLSASRFNVTNYDFSSLDSTLQALAILSDSNSTTHIFTYPDVDLDILEDLNVDLDLDVLEDIEVLIDSAHRWGHNFNFHFSDTVPFPAIGALPAVPAMPAPPVAIMIDSNYHHLKRLEEGLNSAIAKFDSLAARKNSTSRYSRTQELQSLSDDLENLKPFDEQREEVLEKQLRTLEAQQRNFEIQKRIQERQARELERWQERMEAWEQRQQELHQRYEEQVREMSERQQEQLQQQEKQWKELMKELESKEQSNRQ
ncbi:MAG: M56 family metallopeptidase [Bacteroidota bacterium]